MQKTISSNDAPIVSVKGNDYRIHFGYMSKDEAVKIMKNSNFKEKSRSLQKFIFLSLYKKLILIKKTRKDCKNWRKIVTISKAERIL